MKNTIKILTLLCVCTASTCIGRDSDNCHYGVTIVNLSDYAVYFDHYWDTISYRFYPPSGMVANSGLCKVGPHESKRSFSRSCLEYAFTKGVAFHDGSFGLLDTLRFFIFDAVVMERELEYKVLKRYDLSLECLRRLGFRVSYPPGEEMRYIKQYPPFGQ